VRAFMTGMASLCMTAMLAACSSDPTTATGNSSSVFGLARVGVDTLPSLDSGDSVVTNTGVEFREIYLERGSLTLTHDPQPRFETLLHYAWYAVTPTAGGEKRLDPRGVLDLRDHGTVTTDAQGNLLLTSDLDPSVVHVATAVADGYAVHYRFSNVTQAISLFFRAQGGR
jgi:hypothetical protein